MEFPSAGVQFEIGMRFQPCVLFKESSRTSGSEENSTRSLSATKKYIKFKVARSSKTFEACIILSIREVNNVLYLLGCYSANSLQFGAYFSDVLTEGVMNYLK